MRSVEETLPRETQVVSESPLRQAAPGHTAGGMSRGARLAAVLVVVAAAQLDTVVPPLGIPLALLCMAVLFRARSMGWADVGLARPQSWVRTIGAGVLGTVVIYAVVTYVVDPAIGLFIQTPTDLTRFDGMRGNVGMLVMFLVVSWTTAGFGEEIIFRGFVLPGLAEVFGGGRAAWALALVVMVAIFGAGHAYQGWSGVISTGSVGLMLAGLYLVTGRNLWPAVLAHGLLDTVGFSQLFLGMN